MRSRWKLRGIVFSWAVMIAASGAAVAVATPGQVVYRQSFDAGSPGWWIGPQAHAPYFQMTIDRAVGGVSSPSLRVDLPPATLNSHLASPAIPLLPDAEEYTVEFRLRVEMPDSPFRAQLVVLDSLENWIRAEPFLELPGRRMDGFRRFRHSFRADPREGARKCRFFFGTPYLKAFREGRFWIDDVELRAGREVEPLEAYVRPSSAPPGGTLSLHLSSGRDRATLRIFREAEARLAQGEARELTGLVRQPVPAEAYLHGCGWPAATQIEIGQEWRPGVYMAELDDGDHLVDVPFVVRPNGGGGSVLVELPTHTDQAYNAYGGKSFYVGPGVPVISFERPTPSSLYIAPIHLIRWLSREGIDFAVATDDDLHERPTQLLDFPALALTWHSEYWTRAMREGVEDYLDAGGSLLCLSGNTCWWQTRVDGDGHLVCYKYNAGSDPAWQTDSMLVTTHWDEPPLREPPTRFLGLSWREGGMVNAGVGSNCPCAWDWLLGHGGYVVDDADHWVFAGTGLRSGDTFGRDYAIVGYEVDGAPVTWVDGRPLIDRSGGTPPGFVPLGHARCYNQYRADTTGVALMVIDDRGASFVFNGGTTGWCWGLPHDAQVQAVTRNLIDRLPEDPPARRRGRGPLPIRVVPNPAATAVAFELPGSPRPSRLEVFDVHGRPRAHVTTPHRRTPWDLRDDEGRALPAGIYWVTAEGRQPARVVRVR